MSWSKSLLLVSALTLFSGMANAEKITCPDSFQVKSKPHRLNDVSLFQGPPQQLGELMPDTQNKTEWTLKDYQDYAREKDMPLFLVCRYNGTDKAVTIKVPDTAKVCSAWYGNGKEDFHASCE